MISKVRKSVLKIKISPIINFIFILFFHTIFAFILIFIYENEIRFLDPFMRTWNMSPLGWVLLICISIIIDFILLSLLFSQRKGTVRPSDFFILFHCVFILFPFLALHPVTGLVDDKILFFTTIILVLPLFFLIFIRSKPFINFRKIKFLNFRTINFFFLLIICLSVLLTLWNYNQSSSFDLESTAIKRIESRAIYSEFFFFGYILQITYNALLPYLSFISGLKKNIFLFFFIFFVGIYFFYIFGLKSVIINIVISFFLGIIINNKIKIKLLGFYFLGALFLLGFLLFMMLYFFNYFSLAADYFFRRIFTIQAQVSSYYFDFFWNDQELNWSFLTGLQDSSLNYTYYVGEKYYNNSLMNVNANTFVSKIMEGGLLNYTYTLLIISFFFYLLDGYWQSTQNPSFLFIGFLFSALIIEQSYTVAFLSSGVLLLFLFLIFEKVKNKKIIYYS